MPYEDERAGLAAITAIAGGERVAEFRDSLSPKSGDELPPLPEFEPLPQDGTARSFVVAIDGSRVYHPIPGRLPETEAGLVSVGFVVINVERLDALEMLPESRSVDPRELRRTETFDPPMGDILPGRNATRADGLSAKNWFREKINEGLERASLGGETFAETLAALLGSDHKIDNCPNEDCDANGLDMPKPGVIGECPTCHETLRMSDGLRIHTQFMEHQRAEEAHARYMDALEILALMNALRYLASTPQGRAALQKTAFVMDGQLAAFGTIAVLSQAVRDEFRRIQQTLQKENPNFNLIVMSGVKSGPFVEHAEELDRAPQPDSRIPRSHAWLPNNEYIREHIVPGSSAQSKPWGELTHFGRPVIFKTDSGQRLVLNLAQPEGDPPLTNLSEPRALADALATADRLGVGLNQFLPLRRAHAQAAIPFRAGSDLIRTLAQ